MHDLQEELRRWHLQKYDYAPIERIGLKLGEEAGEVQRCIDRIIHASPGIVRERWNREMADEIGDTAIVLLILCARNGLDFEAIVRRRAAEVMAR